MLTKSNIIRFRGIMNKSLILPTRIVTPKNVIVPIEVLKAFICDGVTKVSTFLNIALDETNVIIPIIAINSPNKSKFP
jgi:hypothetical protein